MQHTIEQIKTKLEAVKAVNQSISKLLKYVENIEAGHEISIISNCQPEIAHQVEQSNALIDELLRENLGFKEDFPTLDLLIPLNDFDLEVLKDVVYSDETVEWVFKADSGETVGLHFVAEGDE